MSFQNALQDTCTIYTMSQTNVNGQQKKQETALYTAIPCRKMRSGVGTSNDFVPASDNYKSQYSVLLENSRTGISKNDKVVLDGEIFIVKSVDFVRGRSNAINHIVLYVEQKE